MADIQNLLKIRRILKRKKPNFFAQDSYKKKKVRKRWIRPRGVHAKTRLQKRGCRGIVKIGYRTDLLVRYLDPKSAKLPVVINSLTDLDSLDKTRHSVLISSTVGTKSKINLVKSANERGFIISNVKDASKYVEDASRAFKERLEKKKEKVKAKDLKKKEKESKKSQSSKKESKEDNKEDKKEQKSEQHKSDQESDKQSDKHLDKQSDKQYDKDKDKKDKDKILVTKN